MKYTVNYFLIVLNASIYFLPRKFITFVTCEIHNRDIKQITELNDLRATFDEKLSFNTHIERIIDTCIRNVGFVNRNSRL